MYRNDLDFLAMETLHARGAEETGNEVACDEPPAEENSPSRVFGEVALVLIAALSLVGVIQIAFGHISL